MSKLILSVFLFFISLGNVIGQINGLVKDRLTNERITEVSINVEGLPGQKSNEEGFFTLKVDRFPVDVKFTHISYRDTIVRIYSIPSGIISIEMIPVSSQIDEVVVNTGYQSISKHRITGAVSTVSNDKLSQQVGFGITGMLPAIANSVMFNNNSSSPGELMVRGLSSISASKRPLIIVDNFPYESNLDEINPNDIENVTILKDAAASAIWGVRAGNGVIVVTTKKGQYRRKLSFNFSNNFRLGIKSELDRLQIMNSKDYIELEEFLYAEGNYNTIIDNVFKSPLTPIVESLSYLKKGWINDEEYLEKRSRLIENDVRKEYLKYFYTKPFFRQSHLQASSGGEHYSWLTSIGLDRQISEVKDRNERISFRFSDQNKLNKIFTLSNDISTTYMRRNQNGLSYGDVKVSATPLYPYAQFADSAGNPLAISQKSNDYLRKIESEGKLLDWNYYPLLDQEHLEQETKQWILNINTGLKVKVNKSIDLDMKYNLIRDQSINERLRGEESYYSRDLVNLYTQIPKEGPISYPIPKGGILNKYINNLLVQNARVQLNYNQKFAAHSFTGLLGLEGRKSKREGLGTLTYGYNPDNLSFQEVGYSQTYRDVVTGAMRTIPTGNSIARTELRFISIFSNIVYTYKDRLNISGSIRRDAANLFGIRTNKRWNLLWSIGASYDVFSEREYIDKMKVRASYGFGGNVDPSIASVTTIRYIGTEFNSQYPFSNFSNYANPDLKWETVGTLNLGLDLSMFKERMILGLDVFQKKAIDLYGDAEIDPTAGVSGNLTRNVAAMSAKGLDLDLQVQAVRKKKFGLSFQLNLSYNKDKIDRYFLQQNMGWQFVRTGTISRIEGQPVYSVYSYPFRGLDENGNPKGLVGGEESIDYSGIYNTVIGDMHYDGPVLPRWFGSAGSTIRYKDLSMDFRVLYKFGHFIRTRSINYGILFNQSRTHSDYSLRWQAPGDEKNTVVPSLIYPAVFRRDAFYEGSTVLVESGSHIRLQYIHFRYDFRNFFRTKTNIGIFANADNLGVIWQKMKKNIDPDFEVDYNAVRPGRQYSLGFNFQF